MGNMLPACLVQHQGTTTALPAVKPSMQRLISLKLIVRAVHKLKKRQPAGSNDKIDAKSWSSSSSEAAADGKGGREGELEVMRKVNSNNPKGNVLRSRLHGTGSRGGGHKKGVVRVKVVLSKEEAARLLTLTVGGHKTAAQIVAEIKRMEVRRRRANATAWHPALESIPEESS